MCLQIMRQETDGFLKQNNKINNMTLEKMFHGAELATKINRDTEQGSSYIHILRETLFSDTNGPPSHIYTQTKLASLKRNHSPRFLNSLTSFWNKSSVTLPYRYTNKVE